MKSVEPSLPSDDTASQTFNAYDGPQNVSTGNSTQYNSLNTGSGETHNYGGIQGNLIFNSGTILSGRTDFSGSYAYSSLHPVSTYVQRPDLERQLHKQLLPTCGTDDRYKMRTVVVWGLGGAGKSQLVLNHVQEHRQQYRAVFWVEAGQKEAAERDFVQIYKLLFPSTGSGSATVTVEDAITGVKTWLQGQEERCLWVMDSADEIEDEEQRSSYIDLSHYLPEAPQLDRIITTRSSRAQGMSTQAAVAVAEMSFDEAAHLFRRCAKLEQVSEETEYEVKAITKELGYLALALTLAGSYVSETPRLSSDLRLYLREYRTHRKRLLSRKARYHVHKYRESVLSTWEMSFAAIKQQNPIAARLLTLLAFINFDDIFPHLFDVSGLSESSYRSDSGENKSGRWLGLLASDATKVDEYTIEAGFAVLQAYSFVLWRKEQNAYGMHKLVHAWSHDRLDDELRREWSLALLELLNAVVHHYKGDLDTETRLVPHVVANFTAVSSACRSTYQMPDRDQECIGTMGNLLHRLGRWDDEHEVRVFIMQVKELELGCKHPDTLLGMNNLATVLHQQGKYEQAEGMHRQTLELTKEALGREHPDTLLSMNNLAMVLSEQGKYEQSEGMHRQTLELMKEVLGREHPSTLTSMNNLALVLRQKGKYERSEEMHRQTLELMKEVLGREHPDTLLGMNNLATVLHQQGKYEQSEEMYRQTLELKKRMLGREHPDTLLSMNNLAVVLHQQGKYEQSEEMHRQTLELKKRMLGWEHPDTLLSMNNLAEVLRQQGKYEQSEEMHRQTLELMNEVLGREHPTTLTSMNNLATVLHQQGKYEQSEEMHRQTLELKKRMLGWEHPDTLLSMNNLAEVLRRQGKYEQSEEMHRQTLELKKRILGQEHPSTLTSIINLAFVLSEQGKYERVEDLHKRVLALR